MKKIEYAYRIAQIDMLRVVECICNKYPEIENAERFCLDKTETAFCIKYYSMIRDNALFYRLLRVLGKTDRRDESALEDYIVFADLGTVINHDIKKVREIAEKLFKTGFWLTMNNREVLFVPFEKSGSMSRKGHISFIDNEYKIAVEKEITMGISPERCNISKWYAYKGLSLTDGIRIEEKGGLVFDENKVIVVGDIYSSVKEVETKTLKRTGDDFALRTEKETVECNHFDGEGLISFEYAEKIGGQIKREKENAKDYVSFQVRMPFVKGMLHSCDFKSFFKEKGVTEIKDVFGTMRKVENVEIILTASMFKAMKWRSSLSKDDKMVMASYFSKFKNGRHALYVCGANNPLGNRKNTTTNYQVLHTLKMDSESFKVLVAPALADYELLKTNEAVQLSEFVKYRENSENLDENPGFEADAKAFFKRALRSAPSLLHDDAVKKQINKIAEDRLRDIAVGKIPVPGEVRFLSGDLLYLLYKLADRNSDEKVTMPKSEELFEKRFYCPLPEGANTYNSKYDYAIFRNPHLTRNEHVCLKPFVVEKEGERHKYFGHLHQVVMLNSKSLAPMRLGGADFDGDIVKIIRSSVFVNSAKASCEDAKRLINIPSLAAEDKELTVDNCYNTISQTFFYRVGLFSNYAFQHAVTGYNENTPDSPEKKAEAEKTEHIALLTGMEIDCAKTGVRPVLPEELKSRDNRYFIEMKNLFEEESGCDMKDLVICKASDSKADNGKVMVIEPNEASPNVERLPYIYFSNRYAVDEKSFRRVVRKKSLVLKDEKLVLNNTLSDGEKCKVECLIKAYIKARGYITGLYRQRKWLNANLESIAYILDRRSKKGLSLTSVERVRESVKEFSGRLASGHKNGGEKIVKFCEALKTCDENSWCFTKKEERDGFLEKLLEKQLFEEFKKNWFYGEVIDFSAKGFNLLELFMKSVRAFMQAYPESADFESDMEKSFYSLLVSVGAKDEYQTTAKQKMDRIAGEILSEIMDEANNDKATNKAVGYVFEKGDIDKGRAFLMNVCAEAFFRALPEEREIINKGEGAVSYKGAVIHYDKNAFEETSGESKNDKGEV